MRKALAALAAATLAACDLEPTLAYFVELPAPLHATELLAGCDGVDTPTTAVTFGEYIDDEGTHLGWSLTIVADGDAEQSACLLARMIKAGAVEVLP